MENKYKNILNKLLEAITTVIDVNSSDIEDIKKEENYIVSEIATLCLNLIQDNQLLGAVINNTNLPDICCIGDISNQFQFISYKMESFIKNIKLYKDELIEEDSEDLEKFQEFLNDQNIDSYKNTAIFISKLSPIFSYVEKIFAISENVDDKATYLKLIRKYNKKFEKTLEDVSNHALQSQNFDLGDPDSYLYMLKTFITFTKPFEEDLIKKEIEHTYTLTHSCQQPVYSQTYSSFNDQERLKLIEDVNEQYKRICIDYLPDYDKQIPFHLRDEYSEFRTKTLPEFVKQYKLPLHSNSSSDTAKSALKGISNKNKTGILDILENLSERC